MRVYAMRRAPIALMAAPDVHNCILSVESAMESLSKHPDKANKEIPPQGFIALGSYDENWGWLRYEIMLTTSQYLSACI
jgi:hypothetical protein